MLGVLPGLAMRGQTIGVLRLNGRLLFGGDFIWLGAYGDFESLAPQVVDTSYGGALRVGHEIYVEAQAGYFHRDFQQPGTKDLRGSGGAANLIFGMEVSPHLGVDLVLSGKRISDGSLDKRTIVDLLPLITIRGDF